MASSKFFIDYASAVNVPLSATSATAVIPVNSQLIGVSVNAAARFRVSPVAQATAVATDPLITPNSEIQILRIGGADTNISAILDLSAGTPTSPALSCYRVMEA